MKLQIIIILILLLVLAGCSNSENSISNSENSIIDNCNSRCKADGFSEGKCLSGGSGTGSGCEQANGTQVPSFDRDNPILGCSREAIGSWDECCCFK